MASTTISTPSFVAPTVLPSGFDLRRNRVERGLSVGQLARRARVHRATIHRVEADDPRASDRSRVLVAAAEAERRALADAHGQRVGLFEIRREG